MIFEFKCTKGHVVERLFLTIAAAEGVDRIRCTHQGSDGTQCGCRASRIVSVPGQPILLGAGFHKPSPQGKASVHTADPTKLAAELGGGLTVSDLASRTVKPNVK